MNRQTGIGWMFRLDEDEAVGEMSEVLQRNAGCIVRAAHDLAISRRHLYRLVYRANLWDVVDAARAQGGVVPDEIQKARQEV